MEFENFSRYRFYSDGKVWAKSFGDFLTGSKMANNQETIYHLRNDISNKPKRIRKSEIVNLYNYYLENIYEQP